MDISPMGSVHILQETEARLPVGHANFLLNTWDACMGRNLQWIRFTHPSWLYPVVQIERLTNVDRMVIP